MKIPDVQYIVLTAPKGFSQTNELTGVNIPWPDVIFRKYWITEKEITEVAFEESSYFAPTGPMQHI